MQHFAKILQHTFLPTPVTYIDRLKKYCGIVDSLWGKVCSQNNRGGIIKITICQWFQDLLQIFRFVKRFPPQEPQSPSLYATIDRWGFGILKCCIPAFLCNIFATLFAVVENSPKPVENFGIDTHSMARAIMGLHVNNKKGAIWRRLYHGKHNLLNLTSI